MNTLSRNLISLFLLTAPLFTTVAEAAKPLRALLIAGGCCHDYKAQQKALSEGIQQRANVQVDVYWSNNGTTNPPLPLYAQSDWAKGYDVIIHDECASDIKDIALLNRILEVHQTIPAIHLHCAMHSFRVDNDAWFKHLGLQSSGHGPQTPIDIVFVDTTHPITKTLTDWTTINEELYNNVKLFDAHPLARGKQKVKHGNQEVVEDVVVAWTNESVGARSFSTTIGHNTETVADARYLELVTRGLLWACDKLNDEYMQPFTGENKVTVIDQPSPKTEDAPAKPLGVMPKEATLVKPSASTTQQPNYAFNAFDGNPETRWCADGDSYPQWLMAELVELQVVDGINIQWEFSHAYKFKVEGSADGKIWNLLLDATTKSPSDATLEKFPVSPTVKFVRITGTSGLPGSWCSIREVQLSGPKLKSLWPAGTDGKPIEAKPTPIDPFKAQGNIEPRIEPLTPEHEAEILKDVKVADGFTVTVFAAPPAVNYPVFVAAAPEGTLYVSSDGNGSLGRDPHRGRVIRLRDNNGDGRADETKVFCEVDAPRGLVWDHDRLYLMHPPHLSMYLDKDGDGIADEEKVLVKNLAFGYDKRPADHTTNGLSMGVDGWLYVAGGDFGFMDAEGTDGRRLTHRGGGVIRVQPDGTGLEIYSTGTRNILEVAISPQMDMFARDNTNDGGGWDVRFHHFTGGDDHGYPRLYKNFADECLAPLADYGGGSGCGAVYIDEPGFGDWNDAPYTADWGRNGLFRHRVEAAGATFSETEAPKAIVQMTRPTDGDVDAMSRLFCASWKGATFSWEGPNVGYILCVKPTGFTPEPLPTFDKLQSDQLVSMLSDSSYRRRLAAQRELSRRDASENILLKRGIAQRNETRNLADRLQTSATDVERVKALAHSDPVISHLAIRSLAKRGEFIACFAALDANKSTSLMINVFRALAMMHQPKVVDGLIMRLEKTTDTELQNAILSALCRLHFLEAEWDGQSWGTRPDTRGPYYQPVAWSETPKIGAVLKRKLATAAPQDAMWLALQMDRNRIKSTELLDRLIDLAKQDDSLLGKAVELFARNDELPAAAVPLLIKTTELSQTSSDTLVDAIRSLVKLNSPATVSAVLTALSRLTVLPDADKQLRAGQELFLGNGGLDHQLDALRTAASQSPAAPGVWADAGLLTIASNKNASPEAQAAAKQVIENAWKVVAQRQRLVEAAAMVKNHYLDDRIVALVNTTDVASIERDMIRVANVAANALKLDVSTNNQAPKLGTLEVEPSLLAATNASGDAALGEQLFTKANCVACHTVSKDGPQKGPYLGTIATTYKRPDLAAAILQPNKTIAQGFATTSIVTMDGVVITGFVTNESAEQVTLRDAEAKERTIEKDDIELRKMLLTSVMPEGLLNNYTVHDLASILDYLQGLEAK